MNYENSGLPGVILMLLVLVYSIYFFKSVYFCTSVLQLCENNSLVYSDPEILKNYFILTLAYR